MKKVPGNLIIRGTELRHLEGLEDLRVVGGTLEISDNPGLLDLAPLKNLERAGAVAIFNNGNLTSLDLPSLKRVDGWLTVISNPKAQKLALPELESLGKGLIVKSNPRLGRMTVPSLGQFDDAPYLEFRDNLPSLHEVQAQALVERFRNGLLDVFRGRRFEKDARGLFYGTRLLAPVP
jgi:hypothetical protein